MVCSPALDGFGLYLVVHCFRVLIVCLILTREESVCLFMLSIWAVFVVDADSVTHSRNARNSVFLLMSPRSVIVLKRHIAHSYRRRPTDVNVPFRWFAAQRVQSRS